MIKILNVIREYLISLGYKVDTQGFEAAKSTMNEMGKVVDDFAGSSAFRFAAAGAAITGFVYTAGKALQQFTFGVANADLQNEMFARRMWMSKDAAGAYRNSLSALGVTLNDLYLSPELMDRFVELREQALTLGPPTGFEESMKELREQALTLGPPTGFEESMKELRDITFEFQRFKLEATYAVKWVSYYLTRYLSGPLFGLKGGLREINDLIVDKMPVWTRRIAQVLSWFVRFGNAAYATGKGLGKMWDGLDESTKKLILLLAGLRTLLWTLALPFAPLILGLTALILLYDDFMTHEKGGKSAFPKLWEEVKRLKEEMEEDGSLTKFKENLEGISSTTLDILNNLGGIIAKITGITDLGSVIHGFLDLVNRLLENTKSFLQTIAGSLKDIRGWLENNPELQEEGVRQRNEGFRGLFGINGLFENGVFGSDPFGMNRYFGANPYLLNSIKGNTNISTTISPKYYIYGASNPETVALAIARKSAGLQTRIFQGGIT